MINDSYNFADDTLLKAEYRPDTNGWSAWMDLTINILTSNYRGFWGSTGSLVPNKISTTGEYLYSFGAETNYGSGVHMQTSSSTGTDNPPSSWQTMQRDYTCQCEFNGVMYTFPVVKGQIYHYGGDAVSLYNAIINAPNGARARIRFKAN